MWFKRTRPPSPLSDFPGYDAPSLILTISALKHLVDKCVETSCRWPTSANQILLVEKICIYANVSRFTNAFLRIKQRE